MIIHKNCGGEIYVNLIASASEPITKLNGSYDLPFSADWDCCEYCCDECGQEWAVDDIEDKWEEVDDDYQPPKKIKQQEIKQPEIKRCEMCECDITGWATYSRDKYKVLCLKCLRKLNGDD